MPFTVASGVIALGLLGWIRPLVADRWFRAVEDSGLRISKRKHLVLIGIGLTAVLARLAVIPLQPIPPPIMHDEFSNLLAADTFAHGRLSNPPHPMWIYFDTFHVLQHPTYATKYPPATGLVLAMGELAGQPWLGTLLSMAFMCAAITWMLQGWFPPQWALLGGILALLRLCLFNYWFDAYLGAPTATLGAALVLGAFPRIIHSGRVLDSVGLGTGMVILALNRPLEGFLFCLPVVLMLPFALKRKPWRSSKPGFLTTGALPATVIVAVGLVWLGYYNWRVTGNGLLLPYFLYQRQYFDYPMFAWQTVPPPLHYLNPQFETFFNQWHRTQYRLTFVDWENRLVTSVRTWWVVYLGPMLTVPFLALPHLLRDRRVKLPLLQVAAWAIGVASVVWFLPHYAAPVAAALIVLLVQAMRHLRKFRCSERPIGIYLSRLIAFLVVNWVVILAGHAGMDPSIPWSNDRAQIARQLNDLPGHHLVIVEYAPEHNEHQEWVYNDADIDHAKVVWAREIPGRDLQPLLSYFADRKVWVVHPEAEPPTLELYHGPNAP